MRVVFEHTEYGRIECTQGVAYFASADIERAIIYPPESPYGVFTDIYGTEFHIMWPKGYTKSTHATLHVIRPVLLGFAVPSMD